MISLLIFKKKKISYVHSSGHLSGWSTVAPPMLAFLYCFAQIGLEWTSHPAWITLTLTLKRESAQSRKNPEPPARTNDRLWPRRRVWPAATEQRPSPVLTVEQLSEDVCRMDVSDLCWVRYFFAYFYWPFFSISITEKINFSVQLGPSWRWTQIKTNPFQMTWADARCETLNIYRTRLYFNVRKSF